MKTIQFKQGKGANNGLMTRYNIWTDPNILGVRKAAIRQIPCACASCNNQLSKPWIRNVPDIQQEQYAENRSCEKWPIFEGINNWEIIEILPGSMTNDEEMEGLFCNILENVAEVVGQQSSARAELVQLVLMTTANTTYWSGPGCRTTAFPKTSSKIVIA
jgi:hypothetical protein